MTWWKTSCFYQVYVRVQLAALGAAGTGPATVVLGSHKRAGDEVRLSSLRLEPLEAVVVR